MQIPDSLAEKIEHFRRRGRLIPREYDLFGEASWLAVHIGQGNVPLQPDPVLDYRTVDSAAWLARLKDALGTAARQLPPHGEYLRKLCNRAA